MPCRERDIADALTAAINAGSYSRTVEAERSWVPAYELDKDLTVLRCGVAPALHSGSPHDRGTFFCDYPITVGFVQKITTDVQRDEVDKLTDLVEEVVDAIKFGRLTLDDAVTQASQMGLEYLTHADPGFLTDKGLFFSLVQFHFRILA